MMEPTMMPVAVTARAGLMEFSIQEVKAQMHALHQLMSDVMRKDQHYGVVPGTERPTLLKPGAEKIALLLGLTPSFERQTQWDGAHLTVFSECALTRQKSGVVIAKAGGLCTTHETKFAFRQATRKCPKCHAAAIIKGKAEYGGGWVCFKKKGGCGAKFPDQAPEIAGQSGEREENPNLADTYNTVLKMADKRAFVAAILFGTAASDVFTQDAEDFVDDSHQSGDAEAERVPPPAATKEAPGLSSDELEGHLRDMGDAFSRHEGAAWWRANSTAIRRGCSPEQWTILTAAKEEMKAAATLPTPKQPEPPVAVGDHRAVYTNLRQTLQEAHAKGMAVAWWDKNHAMVDGLTQDEQNALYDLDAEFQQKGTEKP